ncbi:hypothetical protein [Caulobacter soli]|uniref:hypothetical protein n=1 Tax=Caulobacter soli TaxID=2708539 RepID=UPI001FEBC2B4|nr:hypothetical protein [Caulobacter soli]
MRVSSMTTKNDPGLASTSRRALVASAFALAAIIGTPACAPADPHGGDITEPEVRAAGRAWGDALVAISLAYESGGIDKARPLASTVIDKAYGYNLGPVLFKPTLTQAPQTFRLTKEGALAYFVGHDPNYPNDDGFALKGWRKVEIRDVGLQINGKVANTMGNVIMTDKDGKVTTVDKTWTFKKDDQGVVRIILHHSSLPYTGPTKPEPVPTPGPNP